MASIEPAHKLFLSCLGGLLISTSPPLHSLVYFILCIVLYGFSKEKLRTIKTAAKVSLFFLFIYAVGGMFSSQHMLQGVFSGLIKSLPFVISFFFIIIITSGMMPSEVYSGVYDILSLFPFLPAVEIAFMTAMSYRFIIEAGRIWSGHTEILNFRRTKIRNIIRFGLALLASPLFKLFNRAEQLTDAYIFRITEKPRNKPSRLLRGGAFWVVVSFLFAIKIGTIYTK